MAMLPGSARRGGRDGPSELIKESFIKDRLCILDRTGQRRKSPAQPGWSPSVARDRLFAVSGRADRRRILVRGRSGLSGLTGISGGRAVLVRRQDRREQAEDHDADEDHHDEAHRGETDPGEHGADVEKHPGRMAGAARIDPMTATPSPAELPPSLMSRRGKIVFRARRPVALVLPLMAVTEAAGIVCLVIGATIGWFIIAAPLIGLGMTAVVLRPALELSRDGLVQRQYPYSSLTKWSVIEDVGLARAGNRTILAYKLVDGVPPPRHQPARALLLAVNSPYDGGWFADSLVGGPEAALAVVRRYLDDPAAREALPVTRR